jgi:hypothetical protein
MENLAGLKYDLLEFIEEMKANDLVTEKFAAMCRAQIEAANSVQEIQAVRDRLPKISPEAIPVAPAPAPRSEGVIRRDATMGELKLLDDWIEGDRYLIEGKLSQIVVDFRAYEAVQGMEIEIEFDINLAEAKVFLPYTWEFVEKLENKTTAEVKVKGDPDEVLPRNRLVVTGSVKMGGLIVKYKD